MVMDYIKDGDLRKYLQNKNNKLELNDKIKQLSRTAQGLNQIHNQELIHRECTKWLWRVIYH